MSYEVSPPLVAQPPQDDLEALTNEQLPNYVTPTQVNFDFGKPPTLNSLITWGTGEKTLPKT